MAFAEPGQTGPNRVEGIMGLAAGPDGRLYALARCVAWLYWRGSKILVFRRDGSCETTIKPFPPTLPLHRVKATGAFVDETDASAHPCGSSPWRTGENREQARHHWAT